MTPELNIPCPICQTKIPFDPISLVRGHKFSCPKCASIVGIAQDNLEIANQVYDKYETLKKTLRRKK